MNDAFRQHGIFYIDFGCLRVFFLNSKVLSGFKQLRWKNNSAYILYYHLFCVHIRSQRLRAESFKSVLLSTSPQSTTNYITEILSNLSKPGVMHFRNNRCTYLTGLLWAGSEVRLQCISHSALHTITIGVE